MRAAERKRIEVTFTAVTREFSSPEGEETPPPSADRSPWVPRGGGMVAPYEVSVANGYSATEDLQCRRMNFELRVSSHLNFPPQKTLNVGERSNQFCNFEILNFPPLIGLQILPPAWGYEIPGKVGVSLSVALALSSSLTIEEDGRIRLAPCKSSHFRRS